VLRLASSWVWDSWLADDGETFHLFFLKASRALRDPDRRHFRASVGHATSPDLVTWTEVADAIVPSDSPAFDDLATWTGSVVRDGDGWRMFYTGASHETQGLSQRIGTARSSDLITWQKPDPPLVLQADPRWYETLEDRQWHDEAWRDPWVFRAEDGWHMLVTARAREGEAFERGVVGHARSDDLLDWEVLPPLSVPGSGFGHTEVFQLAEVDGRWVLTFSCGGGQLGGAAKVAGGRGGIWVVNASGPEVRPFDISSAYRLADEALYVGRLIPDRAGRWMMLAFRNIDGAGRFGGEIIDPIPVGWDGDRLVMQGDRPIEGMPEEALRRGK
jgi:beta-fructofuranosidase